MPTAVSVSVADAVVAMLADATLSQEIEPVRSYADWEFQLTSECGLLVDVVAGTTNQKLALAARGKWQFTIPVNIAVRKKLGPETRNDDTGRVETSEVDPLILLVEEIGSLFIPAILPGFDSAVWDQQAGGTQIIANPHWGLLHTAAQFAGLVRVFFRVDVAI